MCRALSRIVVAGVVVVATIVAANTVIAATTADNPQDLRDTPQGPATIARFVGSGAVETFGRGAVRAYALPAWRRDAQRAWRAAERAVPDIATAVGVPPSQILPIWILVASSERAYRREAPSWSAAIAQPERHLVVLSGPALRRSAMDAEETVIHEVVHLAVHARLDDIGWMPRWLDEGLAMHFSGYSRISDPLAAGSRGQVRLRDLTDYFPQNPTLARQAYLESEAAVRALLERGSLTPLLDRLAAGDEFDEAFEAIYGESWLHFADRIEGEVASPWRWIGTLGGGAILGLVMAALVIAGAMRVRWRNRRRSREWAEQERAARLAATVAAGTTGSAGLIAPPTAGDSPAPATPGEPPESPSGPGMV
jgi:hypothetical protein